MLWEVDTQGIRDFQKLADYLGGRKFHTRITRAQRKTLTKTALKTARRLIKSKGLIHSGLMLGHGLRVMVPRGQHKHGYGPWAIMKISGDHGYYSLFLEEGTAPEKTGGVRKTKDGKNRGNITQPIHMNLMKQTFAENRATIPKVFAAELNKIIKAEMSKYRIK